MLEVKEETRVEPLSSSLLADRLALETATDALDAADTTEEVPSPSRPS